MLSAGAALGPLLAGVISPTGWNNVFYMLISADVLACLVREQSLSVHSHRINLFLFNANANQLIYRIVVVVHPKCIIVSA